MSRKEIVAAMKDTCNFLDARKVLFEKMILALENEDAGNEEVGVGNEDAGMEGVNEGVAEDNAAEEVAEEEEQVGDEEEDMETDA
ncbi:hypothetical protein QL285_010530 [Trifolium repens]|nr:hypothetical protein QL285_010530 [Trifolium repens]